MRRQGRLHLLALDDHVQEVGRDAPTLEPRPPPVLDGERIELTEVGRTFDRRTGESQLRGLVLVVDAGVAAVLLVGEHLRRTP